MFEDMIKRKKPKIIKLVGKKLIVRNPTPKRTPFKKSVKPETKKLPRKVASKKATVKSIKPKTRK
jgi:hypothetical protein